MCNNWEIENNLVCHMKYKGHPRTYKKKLIYQVKNKGHLRIYQKEMVTICCYKHNCDILVYLILL